MRSLRSLRSLAAISIILAIVVSQAAGLTAKEGEGAVMATVRVDGLACPFCAYGLEKKIKKMEGVEELTIYIDRGTVEVLFRDKKFFDREKLEEAVKEAGFTARKITVKSIGD